MTNAEALALIQAERKEQIEKHGYSIENDVRKHPRGDLFNIAENIAYMYRMVTAPKWMKVICNKTTLQRLTIAGAFCLAENEVFGHNPEADDLLQTIIAEMVQL